MTLNYFTNTSWLFVNNIIRIFIVLIVTVLMARYLGPESFGIFNYSYSVVTLFAVVSSLGLDQLVRKQLLNNPSNTNYILGTSFSLRIIGALLLIIISTCAISHLRPDDTVLLLLTTVFSLSFIFKSFDVIKYWFESHVQAKYCAIVEMISISLSLIIKILLILYNAPLIAFAWAVFAETLFVAVGLLIAYNVKSYSICTWRVSKGRIANLFKEAWPLIFAGALYQIYTRIDQVMLGNMISNESVGIYAVAVKLSEGWIFIPTVIATSFFPSMLNARNRDYNLYLIRTQHLLNTMALISVMAVFFVYIFATVLISFVFTERYHETSNILIIHIWGCVFTAMSTIAYRYFIAEGLQKSSFYRGLVGVIVNICLNYILIPIHGASGAAMATVISQIMALYLFNAASNTTRPMFYMQTKALILINTIYTFKYLRALVAR